MSQRKACDHMSKILNDLLKETREYKSYELGVAYGWLQLYVHILKEFGKDDSDKIFNSVLIGTENVNTYFREFVKLYNEDNSEFDNLLDNWNIK